MITRNFLFKDFYNQFKSNPRLIINEINTLKVINNSSNRIKKIKISNTSRIKKSKQIALDTSIVSNRLLYDSNHKDDESQNTVIKNIKLPKSIYTTPKSNVDKFYKDLPQMGKRTNKKMRRNRTNSKQILSKITIISRDRNRDRELTECIPNNEAEIKAKNLKMYELARYYNSVKRRPFKLKS